MPNADPAPSWCYPGALELTLRRALADTRTDATISDRRRARLMAAYEHMLATLETALRGGPGRPTRAESLTDADRSQFADRLDDVLIDLRKRDKPVTIKGVVREMFMEAKTLRAYLKALGYGTNPQFW
jgi:hypothetical protein